MEQHLGSSSRDRLSPPIPGGDALTAEQRRTVDFTSEIPGWGSDLDPERRPGVPRDKAPYVGVEALYPEIEPQVPRHRIHKSTEHARLTPVFGTSCPPRGLSGKLRDIGYRYSEGRMLRWMTLILADRVDMVEGVLGDFARMRPPNLVRETGLKSEWRYNRAGLMKKVAIVGAGALAAYLVLKAARRRD
jgi:hypothetical protein